MLERLPPGVQESARVFRSSGKVAWPAAQAREAVEALADAGAIIISLDARILHSDGTMEEEVISDLWRVLGRSHGDKVQYAREVALEAIPRAIEQGSHVVIGWEEENPSRYSR